MSLAVKKGYYIGFCLPYCFENLRVIIHLSLILELMLWVGQKQSTVGTRAFLQPVGFDERQSKYVSFAK